MIPDEASDELQRQLEGEHGILAVEADNGRIVVKVSEQRAGREVMSRYGGAYEGWPIMVEEASRRGILQVDAAIGWHPSLIAPFR